MQYTNKLRAFCLGVLLVAGLDSTTVRAADTQVGNVTNVTLTGSINQSANFWINNGGVAAVTPLAPDVVRVQYYFAAPLWAKEEPMIAKTTNQWSAVGATYTDNGATYTISTPQLDVVVTKSPFKVDFKDKTGYYLSQDSATYFNSAYNYSGQSGWNSGDYKLKALRALPSNQAIFGVGEYGGALNRHGIELECWSVGTYNWGETQKPEYMNMPFFYGVQPANGNVPAFVYGIFFNNPCRPLFSFGSAKSGANNLSFEAGDGQMDYFFFGGGASHNMAGVVDRYSELTGRPTMLPKWAFGYQLSRFSYANQGWVEYLANTATSSNLPLDAVYLDIDYMDADHNNNIGDGQLRQLSFSTDYPDPVGMANTCAAKGVKLVPLIEPWLEPGDTTLYNDANGAGNKYFIRDNSSNTVTRSIYVGNVSWFDFSNSTMTNWWAGKIAAWTFPLAGIWNDLTEPEGGDQIPSNGLMWLDNHWNFASGDSRGHWDNEHNYFGLRCSANSYAAMKKKYPDKRPFVLSRSGTTGLQRYAISWSGDTRANWTYARTVIPFGISAMISGAGYYGHDLGGFAGSVDGELITRCHEWGAFLPFYREHSEKGSNVYGNGEQGREPWRFSPGNGFDRDYFGLMKGNIRFRYRMMPYLYSLAYKSTQTGEPMNTPTAFQFYGDNNTASLNNYDFMVGDYILVPPVYSQGATTRDVYLPWSPNVAWYYFASNARYTGGQTVNVSTPLGGTNMFVRSGAIIPMGHVQQYIGQTNVSFLDIHCWPEGTSTFKLYEDAGEGWDFTNSNGRATYDLTSARGLTNWDFTISARSGGYTNPVARSFYVYANNPPAGINNGNVNVSVNGSSIPYVPPGNINDNAQDWTVTAAGKLEIRVPDDGTVKNIHVDWAGGTPVNGGPEMAVPGTWLGNTSWDTNAPPFWMTRVDPPGTPAAATWFTNLIRCAASGGDVVQGNYQFKLRASHLPQWGTNWGFNVNASQFIAMNTPTTLAPGGTTNVFIAVTNGFYYAIRTLNPQPNANATIVVLKLSGAPVTATFNGISPAFPKSTDAVTVNVTLSGTLPAEEHVYVRYTTDNWATCSFVEATGSGTAYSAIIPVQPSGTAVKYYILTTTATTGSGLTCGAADSLTLNLDTATGANYTYTPAPMPWPGVGYPSSPADQIHHWKEEAIIGNGFLTAMLDQNGSVYDYYFPSPGVAAGSDTANEGYHAENGPEWPYGCTQNDAEASGQMNLIASMAGIALPNGTDNPVYWLKNETGTNYTDVGQRWVSDDTDVVVTSNRLAIAGSNIKVQQYDFVPSEDAIPTSHVSGAQFDTVRTNRAVHVKRFLLTNNEGSTKTINFYWDANFNIKGSDAYDFMTFEGTVGGTNYSAMIVGDTNSTAATGSWCGPNGYGGTSDTEYNPDFAGNTWVKSNSVYFATVMKLVTNSVTGAGSPCDGSWRDHTTNDNQEGWIGKTLTIPAGQTVEVDVMTVGTWDTFAAAAGTHAFWGRPMINWFYSNNMSNVQATTEAYWTNWLGSGVTVQFPDPTYDRLFKRSLIISKLHCDPVGGAVVAGMHNGAYPFVWPRDGVYAAITFDRVGHQTEATAFYKWLNNAQRPPETWGAGYFFQKYTTDGRPVWRNPQVDETASIPWGMYYHYLTTGDGAFLSNNWTLARTSAEASSRTGTNDFLNLNYDAGNHLIWSWSIWEDVVNEHLYSNGSVVRGLNDAATIADYVGQSVTAGVFRARATDIKGNASQGIVKRINDNVEASDISQLGLVYPFEVFTPTDPLMTNLVERLHGRQVSGGTNNFFDNIVETDPETSGMVRRYNHKLNGEADIYWSGGPWSLSTSWYGEYFARWQDYLGGKSLINTNKAMLDKIIAKLGPMGSSAEQFAVNSTEQKYPGFWLQTAWPNVWESHSTLVDQMMMFLDYAPQTNNTCTFAPKLPAGWSTLTFNNLAYKNQRFDVTVTEGASLTRVDLNKRTAGALNADFYLRIPAGNTPVMVVTNGQFYVPSPSQYDTATGRVRINGPLTTAAGNNVIAVTYGAADYDNDGATDAFEMSNSTSPIDSDSDDDGITDGYEYNNALNPNSDDSALDKDGDGQSNLSEFISGTVANDATSSLHITDVARQLNGDVIVTATSVNGKKYVLVAATSPAGSFNPVGTTNTAAGATISFTDPAVSGATKVYKVQYIP